MIFVRDYDDILRTLGREYFVFNICYVSDLVAWSKKRGVELSEPHHQFMKLISEEGDKLTMFIQSESHDEILDDVIKVLSMRGLLKETVSDPSRRLDSIKKRLAYCFLKEYARIFPGASGDEPIERADILSDFLMRQRLKISE